MEKVCSKCGLSKPIEEFALNKTKSDGHSNVCKECFKIYREEHYKKNRQYYIDKAGSYRKRRRELFNKFKETLKCSQCGEARWWLLDFHHIDSSAKDTEVGHLLESPRKLEEELKKCTVLCANCHRDLHYKERIRNREV